MNEHFNANFPSCSTILSRDSHSNDDQSGENSIGSLTTVSASCEAQASLDLTMFAKNVSSKVEQLTYQFSGCIQKQLKIMYIMCFSAFATGESKTNDGGHIVKRIPSIMQWVSF